MKKLSIVIPARNEAEYLPRCLKAIKAASKRVSREVEVVVVLNRCTDNTEQIARDAGCVIANDDSKNLAKIRNSGVRKASGDLIVTIDADSFMSEGLLLKIERALARENVIGGGVLMLPERWSLGIFCTFLALVPVAAIYRISGGVFFCRREAFDAIGGFNEEWFTAEDIDFARRLKAYGKTQKKRFVTIFSSYIVTSCRKFDEFGDWYAIRHPKLFYEILFNKNREAANTFWYDVER